MRKIFAALLSAVCLICLGLAAACAKEPEYFTLIYAEQAGITYDFGEIKSGAEIKKGFEVTFKVAFDEALEGDEPAVMANETELEANEDGVYSFIMNEDTNISVIGVFMPDKYEVAFDAGNAATGENHKEYRVWYYDLEGNELTGVEGLIYNGGEKVSFTLKVSVYYSESDYKVAAGTLILEPDENGVYSFDVYGDTRVTIEGLEEDLGFTARDNGGAGTAENPYKIEKPIDLYYMADLVGNSFYSGRFASAYYRLEADIDMKGEQLYIIGDRPTDDSISMFFGDFDGNGHTISNYIIKDSIIEQSGFTEVPLRYLGLFGYVVARNSSPVNIYDLTLDNFEIEVNGSKYLTSGFYAGGLLGYGTGVNITNCNVSGTIVANGNTVYFSQVGGVAGYLQSAYNEQAGISYHTGIVGTHSDVEIECTTGHIYSAGGIAGIITASDEKSNAYILNSYSSGSVSGAMYTGGVVGYMGPYTSVTNSYASGADVYARNELGASGGAANAYAYAGGIAGYASYDTIIANTFSAVDELGATSSYGSAYEKTDKIVGGYEAAAQTYVQTRALLLLNVHDSEDVQLNETFYKETLGWNDGDWNFEGEYPVAKDGAASLNYKLTIKNGGNVVKEININSYDIMSDWYEKGLPEYIDNGNGMRSYGYFFDAEETRKVPFAFIPTGNMEIYVNFADYSEVAGKYFIRMDNGDEAYFLLGNDGSLEYRYGALSYETLYVYNGESILLERNPAFTETVENNGSTATFFVYGLAYVGEDKSTLLFTDGVNYTEGSPLVTVKEISEFNYGGYYASDNSADYIFRKDGTGLAGNAPFTYTLSGNTLRISLPTGNVTCTVSGNTFVNGNVTYTAYDEFAGVWEKSAKAHEQYYFDGKGNWEYTYFYYDSNGDKISIKPDARGTYEKRNDTLVLDNGKIVGYDTVNKWITIEDTPYYKENSVVGEWKFFSLKSAVTIVFHGIGADGYGSATAYYGTGSNSYELSYEVTNTEQGPLITLMDGITVFGNLLYSARENTLTGAVYLVTKGEVTENALFCLYDDFKGVWLSEIGTVEFNGLGKYNIKGTADYTKMEGTVKINGKRAGTYTVNGSGLSGEFTYNNVVYKINYNLETGEVDVTTSEEGAFKLAKADALYGLNFVGGDGKVYTFNGGGNLASGGVLTIKGEEKIYSYFNDGSFMIIKDGDIECGSLALVNGEYKLTLNSATTTLVIENVFTGSWFKGGENVGAVEIGVINGDNTASGTYLGTSVTYVYNKENDYLSFKYNGETLYIVALRANRIELAVSDRPDTFGNYDVCVENSVLDSLGGVYAGDGDSSVTLDGLSDSIYASGTATVRKSGAVTAAYSYVVNRLNEIEFSTFEGETIVYYVFAEVAAGTEDSYTLNGHSYKIIATDYFYLKTRLDSSGVAYTFNGYGTVTTSNGKEFTYVIESYDSIIYEYTLTLTDGNKTYTAIYSQIVGDYNITLTPDWFEGVSATAADGKVYAFDGKGKVTISGEKNYVYTVEKFNPADGTFTMTLSPEEGSEDTAVYTAVYNSGDGSITVTEKEAEKKAA